MLSLQQLRTPMTRKQGVDWALTVLQSFGFQTTAWQPGRIQHSLVTIFGTFAADFTEGVKDIAEFGLNEYASGDILTLFSRSRFSNTRNRATRTSGPMTLTNTSSTPYTIQVGQLLAVSDTGVEFRNTTGGTLAGGSAAAPTTLPLIWESRLAGAETAVPNDSVRRLSTPLSGASVRNNGGPPWYTVAGRDEESDALLRERNATRWARLTVELVADSYKNIALTEGQEAGIAVAKVKVDDTNPRGPGTLDVYVAGELAELGGGDIGALQAIFASHAFATDAWPPASDSRVLVRGALQQDLDLDITVYHDPGVEGLTVKSGIEEALEDLLRRTPIGGFEYAPVLLNVVTLGDMTEAAESVEGVRTVVFNSPTSNVSVSPLGVLVRRTWTITPIAVT